ncbi:hypothetical protein WMF31_22550 [Sorangium sp. So ce1036]|uniref:hypothetical protein n=1 Tax=Sorangium sp. So ce1036 TaxID=3133328 RepID=UPI003F063F44
MESEGNIRSITLEELAAISGALEAGVPRDEALAGAGLSVAAWEAARERWLSRLAARAARGQLGATRRYLALVAEQKRRVQAEAREPRKKPEGPMPVAPSAHLSPLQGAGWDRAAPQPAASASGDAATRSPWARGSSAAALADTSARPPLPPTEATPPQQPALVPGPPVTAPRRNKTLVVMEAVPMQAALPFKQDTPGASPAGDPATQIAPGQAVTVAGVISPFASRKALPFARPGSSPPADGALPFARPGSSPPADGALPFARPSPPPPADSALPFARPSAPPPVDSALPFARPSAPPAASRPPLDEGVTIPRQRPERSWALPFQQPNADGAPSEDAAVSEPAIPARADAATMRNVQRITLAQYARICASTRDYPEQLQQIQRHYGLTPQAWEALHATWHERFQRDPALKARWQALVERSARR